MRSTIRRLLPMPAVDAINRLRSRREARVLAEWIALSQVPEVQCDASRARRALDLGEALAEPDPTVWEYVSGRIEAGGLTHNHCGINPGDRRALSALVTYVQPKSVLEVGTHVGSSTLTLAATLPGSSKITTVDIIDVNDAANRPWEQFGAQRSPAQLVRGEPAPVDFVVGSSLSFLAGVSERYDFIFLDGDHAARTLYRELPLALSRLTSDGLILLHDYFPRGMPLWPDGMVIPGPWLACRRLRHERAPIQVEPLGQLAWQTKQGTNITSLAVVLGR